MKPSKVEDEREAADDATALSDEALLAKLDRPLNDDLEAQGELRKKKLNAYQSRCYSRMLKLVKDRPESEIKRLRCLAHAKAKEMFMAELS